MKKLVGAISLLFVASGGCSLQNDNICSALPSVEERMQASRAVMSGQTDPSTRVFASITTAEFCIQQTARNFSTGDDRADVIAKAVVGHCTVAISRVVDAQRAADRANNNSSPVVSFATGRVTTLEARTFDEMEKLALARVVEARAGHCKATR